MNEILRPNDGLLFMKVGVHAGETLKEILERKKTEYKKAGMIFWGYGGGTCHPTRAVQPFARLRIEEGARIYIAMEEIDSHHPPSKLLADEYSEDGLKWKPIPPGVEVRGSRYAVILDELIEGDLDLDLSSYQVAVGPSSGKAAGDYVRGRVDKACIVPAAIRDANLEPKIKKVHFMATIKAPYAVFTRDTRHE